MRARKRKNEKQWGVVKVTDAKMVQGKMMYEVLWEDVESSTAHEARTWEPEDRLREDGMGRRIGGFWCSTRGKELKARGLRSTSSRAR